MNMISKIYTQADIGATSTDISASADQLLSFLVLSIKAGGVVIFFAVLVGIVTPMIYEVFLKADPKPSSDVDDNQMGEIVIDGEKVRV